MRPLYVSFFTPDYSRHAMRLIASLKAHDLDFEVDEVAETGRWINNCAKKPKFILEKLIKHVRPIVWLDADAELKAYPDLFDALAGKYDIAVCKYQWKRARKCETLSGTVWVNSNPCAAGLVGKWAELQSLAVNVWDQKTLEESMASAPGLRVYELPVEYCCITDFHKQENPGISPVIEQFQASRTARRLKP